MLGPVSAWVGDHLWTDKPPRCRTRHQGLLSLSPPSVESLNEHPAKAGEVKGTSHDTLASIHGLAVFAGACLNGLACGDEC